MKFQLWRDGDNLDEGYVHTFSTARNCERMLQDGKLHGNLIWEVEAATWEEANEKYELYMKKKEANL